MALLADVLNEVLPQDSKGAAGSSPCGLWVSGSDTVVPLRLRSVASTVYCDTSVADTTETFAFLSDFDASVIFRFPLPPRSAAYKLEATIGDRQIVTTVKEKAAAQATFDDAVAHGDTAVLAKQEDSSQVFSLELGNLQAMQEAIVTVSYLRLLGSVDGACEYEHVSTWTPPYVGSRDVARGEEELAQQNPKFASKVSYTLNYDITLLSERGIQHVETGAPITSVDLPGGGGKRVTLSEALADPSKDFQLLVELGPEGVAAQQAGAQCPDGHATMTIQQQSAEHSPVALLTFVPHDMPAGSIQGTAAQPEGKAAPAAAPHIPVEIILIVDCSGSMGGSREQQAREAALFFVQDLPINQGVKFNVVAFGSNHISWSKGCKEVTAASKLGALAWCKKHINSDLGGTEILSTFEAVYAVPVEKGYTRRIIFLTDGGISGSEEEAVFSLVSLGRGGGRGSTTRTVAPRVLSAIQRLKNKVLGRDNTETSDSVSTDQGDGNKVAAVDRPEVPAVLCLGIGHGVHRGLLDGVATRSSGVAQYMVDGESIVRKVSLLRKVALCDGPAVRNARLVVKGATGVAVPHVLPVRLFPGEPLHVLVELQKLQQDEASVELHGTRGNGMPFAITVPLKGAPIQQGQAAYSVLHGLAMVSGLLAGTSALHVAPDGAQLSEQPSQDAVRAAVVEAATRHNLVTRYTAAVGVMVQKDPLDPKQVKRVEVPLAVPHGASLFQGINPAYEEDQDTAFCMMPPQNGAPRPCTVSAAASMYSGARCAAPGFKSARMLSFGQAQSRGLGCPAPRCASPMAMAPAMLPACAAPGGAPVDTCKKLKRKVVMKEAAQDLMQQECMAADMSICEDEEAESDCMEALSPPPPMPAACYAADTPAQVAAAAPLTTPAQVLSHLNLARTPDGKFVHEAALMRMLVSQVAGEREPALAAAEAARPAALSADMWATVLALAFLRKHCTGDKGVWEAMEMTALAWLNSCWPQGHRSVAVTVLSACKLV